MIESIQNTAAILAVICGILLVFHSAHRFGLWLANRRQRRETFERAKARLDRAQIRAVEETAHCRITRNEWDGRWMVSVGSLREIGDTLYGQYFDTQAEAVEWAKHLPALPNEREELLRREFGLDAYAELEAEYLEEK